MRKKKEISVSASLLLKKEDADKGQAEAATVVDDLALAQQDLRPSRSLVLQRSMHLLLPKAWIAVCHASL